MCYKTILSLCFSRAYPTAPKIKLKKNKNKIKTKQTKNEIKNKNSQKKKTQQKTTQITTLSLKFYDIV